MSRMRKAGIYLGVMFFVLGVCDFAVAGNTDPSSPSSSPRQDKPNIILIFSDDVGFGNISCYGADNFKTPNIDALAENGLRFANFYAMPQCAPSRCVTLTGRYPFRTGLIVNNIQPAISPKKEVMIPTILKKAGYVTACVGKWHLPLDPKAWGFDENLVFPGSGRYWRGEVPQSKYYHINGEQHDLPEGKYLPDIMHDFLADFMTRHTRSTSSGQASKPFFIYYPMSHIHAEGVKLGDVVPTPDSKPGADKNRIYTDNIEYMDKLVGKLMNELDRLDLRKNTLVIFTCDNGTSGEYAKMSTVSGRGLSGHKLSMLDCGGHVPMVCSWPGVTPAGKVIDDLVDISDFFTTFADLGGAKLPDGVKIDGRSFAPQLRGEKGSPRDWVYVQLKNNWYVRNQAFKLNESNELFDMSDAPFAETLVDANAQPEVVSMARKSLRTVLDELNPSSGPFFVQGSGKSDGE